MRAAALAWAIAFLCVSPSWSRGQHGGGFRSGSRFQSAPHQFAGPRYQGRPGAQYQGRPQGNGGQRPAYGYPGSGPNTAYPRAPYMGQRYAGPGASGYGSFMYAPPGHLSDWLNRYRSLPAQEQERMLRNDPSFRQLSPDDQQRLLQQLHEVRQMPEEQRQRRLARAEMIERLSPEERMRVNLSARRWAYLPPDRQALMKSAFQQLSAVPLDQRQTVLNSARYQSVFSPEERGILSDLLRVEPYEPAR